MNFPDQNIYINLFSFLKLLMSTPKHPASVEGYSGSLEDLAKAVGNMRYDCAAGLIDKLADDIKQQADSDSANGRTRLAGRLYSTAQELYLARDGLLSAWEICKPYMKDKE